MSGHVAFDESGDRLMSDYEIINIIDRKKVIVGNYMYSKVKSKMQLDLNLDVIVWPGEEKDKPVSVCLALFNSFMLFRTEKVNHHFQQLGFMVPRHLKVVTVAEKPFVYVRDPEDGNCKPSEIACPHTNDSETVAKCCGGYCMQLLAELSKR